MQIHISANDGVPIYLQIVNQVKYLIASGRLKSEDELPPIRVLADRLIINPNTVARAYRELEVAGRWSGEFSLHRLARSSRTGARCCRLPRASQNYQRTRRRTPGRSAANGYSVR